MNESKNYLLHMCCKTHTIEGVWLMPAYPAIEVIAAIFVALSILLASNSILRLWLLGVHFAQISVLVKVEYTTGLWYMHLCFFKVLNLKMLKKTFSIKYETVGKFSVRDL